MQGEERNGDDDGPALIPLSLTADQAEALWAITMLAFVSRQIVSPEGARDLLAILDQVEPHVSEETRSRFREQFRQQSGSSREEPRKDVRGRTDERAHSC